MNSLAGSRRALTGPQSILGAIGATPLVSVEGIYAKLETLNPTGSVKDRMVWRLVQKAEKRGKLKAGSTVIEATSGNTGIALAMISAVRKYKLLAVMPESASVEKQWIMQQFGAELILTPAEDGMAGALLKSGQLALEHPEAWAPAQFENPDNIQANSAGLGRELLQQTAGMVDYVVAGVGTGGTLLGVAKALRRVNPDVQAIAVEPEESAVLSGGKACMHEIQGVGEGFVPSLVMRNLNMIDGIMTVPSNEAKQMSRWLARRHALWVGISSGANFLAAMELKRRKGVRVLTILPDTADRYLSILHSGAQGNPAELPALHVVRKAMCLFGRQPVFAESSSLPN